MIRATSLTDKIIAGWPNKRVNLTGSSAAALDAARLSGQQITQNVKSSDISYLFKYFGDYQEVSISEIQLKLILANGHRLPQACYCISNEMRKYPLSINVALNAQTNP